MILCHGFLAVLLAWTAQAPVPSSSAVPESEILAAQDLIARGELDSARARIAAAVQQHPRAGGLYNLLGIIDAKENKLDAAEAQFARAIRFDPSLLGAHLNLGRVQVLQIDADSGAASRAETTFRRLVASWPDQTEARFELARLLEWRGAFSESLSQLAALPKQERARARALALTCVALAATGKQAEQTCDALAAASDLSEADIVSILPVLEAKHRYALVARLLQALDRRQLASLETLEKLGSALENTGDFAAARETYERVAREKRDAVPPLLDLARVAYRQKDFAAALGYLAHARDLEPENANVHFLFGMIAAQMDLPFEARKSLEKATAIDPANAYYNYALGSVLLETRHADDAVASFRKYVTLKPHDPRGKFALGVVYYSLADFSSAAREMTTIANDKETAAGAHYFLGRIAKEQDDDALAEKHLQKSIALLPDFAESRAELASVWIRMERYSDAETEVKRALAIDANSYLANAALLALYKRTADPRTKEQATKVQEIVKRRNERQELMLRTIEARPY